MSLDDPKAELHDIGKLIDWVKIEMHQPGTIGEPHEFERCIETPEARKQFDVQLGGSAWRAIVRKDTFEKLRNETWPQSHAWIFVSLADHLAAGYGRTIPENKIQLSPKHHYRCLWKDTDFGEDPRLKERADLTQMITFLNGDPSWEEAKERYGDLWKRRAETARPGLNVTTLLSHSEVVGKLARVIARMDWQNIAPTLSWDAITSKTGTHSFRMIVGHYRIGFAQKPYRVRDLGVFAALRNLMDELYTNYPDNILSHFENELITIFENENRSKDFEQSISQAGFLPLKREESGTIQAIENRNIGKFQQTDLSPCYPTKPVDRIELPICENCQMKRATKQWPTDRKHTYEEDLEGFAVEPLCAKCFDFRENHPPLTRLNQWQEGKALWLRIHLDIDTLRDSLTTLNRNLLISLLTNSHSSNELVQQIKQEFYVAYPVLVDFLADYKTFLEDIHEDLETLTSESNIEQPLSNLWCLRLEDKQQVLDIIQLLYYCYQRHFPNFLENESANNPIRFGLSLSNFKYPFFKHLQFLDIPEQEVSLQVVNSGQAQFRLFHVPCIVEHLKAVSASAAHRLALIAETSRALAKIALKDNSEKGIDVTAVAALMPDVLDFESLRTLVNLSKKETRDG